MAEVFRARRVGAGGFSKVVCIKRMHQHLSSDQEFVALFLDEGRTGAKLRHRNIVTIDDLGEHEGQYFIAMEFVHGVDLSQIESRLKTLGEPFPANVAVTIAMEIFAALAAAHRATDPEDGAALKVVHRDVAPHNILVSFAGEVKLGDFGIARAERRAQVTSGAVVRGRFGYMPLEQLSGTEVDHRADLFALGVVLFEMLAGQRPFLGHMPDAPLEAIIAAQVTDRRPPLKSLRGELSDDLCSIVDTLLAKEPNERFNSAEVALTVLERCPERSGGTQALSAMMSRLFPSQASVAAAPRMSLPSVTPTQPQEPKTVATAPPRDLPPQPPPPNATPTDIPRSAVQPEVSATQPSAATNRDAPTQASRKPAALELVTDKSDPMTKPFSGPTDDEVPIELSGTKPSRLPVILLVVALVVGGTVGTIAVVKNRESNNAIVAPNALSADASAGAAVVAEVDVQSVVQPLELDVPVVAVEQLMNDVPAANDSASGLPRHNGTHGQNNTHSQANPQNTQVNPTQNPPSTRGTLVVNVSPFGQVSIDNGRLTEQFSGAREFILPAGEHSVRVTGGVEGRRTVTVVGGATARVTFTD